MVVGLNKFKDAFADYPYYVGKLAGACLFRSIDAANILLFPLY